MTPRELLDRCLESMKQWAEHQIGEEPTIMLVVPRKTAPMGESIRLYGRSGPKGRIATIKEAQDGYEVVAYFPAIPIAQDIAAHLGIEIRIVSEEPPTAGSASGKEEK